MENGIDISLKALQEYATEKGIKVDVSNLSFMEKHNLMTMKILDESKKEVKYGIGADKESCQDS